jgi:CRISPR-associated protein Csm1
VFAVGRWDLIIEFAEKVRNDFRKFVCNREDISISGGIALVGHKFPLAKAAQMAGEAEDKAKSYGGNPQKGILPAKNAINLFGENIAWGDEFSFVKNLSDELHRLLKEGKIAKSLLQRFFIFRKIKEDGRQDWRWLSAYAFARYQKSNNVAIEELEKLKMLMITGSFENLMLESGELKSFRFETTRALDLLCIAARWADFRNRE